MRRARGWALQGAPHPAHCESLFVMLVPGALPPAAQRSSSASSPQTRCQRAETRAGPAAGAAGHSDGLCTSVSTQLVFPPLTLFAALVLTGQA